MCPSVPIKKPSCITVEAEMGKGNWDKLEIIILFNITVRRL